MKNTNIQDYYLGLDIGTNSVGWAVTDENYNILKFNKKYMQGVRMFDAMETAEARRAFRTTRRRCKRRKDRLCQLQSYFEEEIKAIDPGFFIRLEEGFLQDDDRTQERTYTFFNDKDYNDTDFHREYPTIYHLRYELVKGSVPNDLRLVYLALHHIMKYRGHFLFHGNLNMEGNIDGLIEELNSRLEAMFGFFIYDLKDTSSKEKFQQVLTDKRLNKTNRTKELKKLQDKEISKDIKNYEEIHKLISARKVNLEKLFIDKEFDEKVDIQFDDSLIDEKMDQLTMLSDEEYRIIELAKGIYDWSLLKNILGSSDSISDAMMKSYEKHKEELSQLKKIVRAIGKEDYKDLFSTDINSEKTSLYQAYIDSGVKGIDGLYRGISKILKKAPTKYADEVSEITRKIENKDYLLKQRIPTNGVIPHQVHLSELVSILDASSRKFEFLNEVDETGLSKKEQIIEIFRFRVPYYIGPLNDAHRDSGFAWVVRKEPGKVYPWNFHTKVDEKLTAEAFIKRMTNKCSYLLDEDVLPKGSLLYQKFMVLNTINNLRFNDQAIDPEIKQRIYNDLFVERGGVVSKRKIVNWAKANLPEYFEIDIEVTGIDNTVNASLASLHSLRKIFDKVPSEEICEKIIYWSTIFNEEKHILIERIKESYPNTFTDEELSRFSKINFVGWGRLSRMLLEGLVDGNVGYEPMSIIQALYYTNKNLMELLSKEYSYTSQIEEHNSQLLNSNRQLINYEMLDLLNIPPSIKRAIWQTIRITEEINKVMKREPAKIFVEVAREDGKKVRTTSRKEQLKAFYKAMDVDPLLRESLEEETDHRLRQRKLYLYYRQLGRCMYTGQSINFSNLLRGVDYDLDHIYPRSLTDDDSLVNLVLVTKEANEDKSDCYPIKKEIQGARKGFWNQLRNAGLIEKEKYNRLTRNTKLTTDELAGFVARQLVETRQSTKAVMTILDQIYPTSKVITIKAQHIDKFRHDNGFVKVRFINDFHHARDAYLAIVVGNVYFSKFTDSPRRFVKEAKRRSYNLSKVIEVKEPGQIISDSNGVIAWESGHKGTISTVKEMMDNNQILTTYMIQERTGGLYDQTRYPAGKGDIPFKKGLDVDKYGGFKKPTYSYYVLAEIDKKKERHLIPVPLFVSQQIENEEDLENYLSTTIKENFRIILPRIPAYNTLLEIEGAKNRITGVSGGGRGFVLRNEHQPHFNDGLVKIFKELEKIKAGREDLIPEMDSEVLMEMYDEIIKKMDLRFYKKRLEKFKYLAVNNRDKVQKLEKKDQIDIIWELTKLLKSSRDSSNLLPIGGSSQSGVNSLGKNLSNREKVFLIHQSVTGLYEQKVDLLKL